MPEPTRNIESTEPSTLVAEVRVLLIPSGEGTSKAAEAPSAEPIIIILHDLTPVVPEPSVPSPPENVP